MSAQRPFVLASLAVPLHYHKRSRVLKPSTRVPAEIRISRTNLVACFLVSEVDSEVVLASQLLHEAVHFRKSASTLTPAWVVWTVLRWLDLARVV